MTEREEQLFLSLYTDEDVTDRLAQALRERGFEAASAADWGTFELSDEEPLGIDTELPLDVLFWVVPGDDQPAVFP